MLRGSLIGKWPLVFACSLRNKLHLRSFIQLPTIYKSFIQSNHQLINYSPTRSFFFFKSLDQLASIAEQQADQHPNDAKKQAEYYKLVLDDYPELIIKRYEDHSFARNNQCTEYYIIALYECKKYTKLIPMVMAYFSKSSGTGQEGMKGTNEIINLLDGIGTKEQPFYVSQLGSTDSSVFKRLGNILNVVLALVFIAVLLQSQENRFGISTKIHRYFKETSNTSNVTFNDIQGVDEAKKELEDVVDFLRNPVKYTKFGAKMPKGVLLVGPPGTGKTLLAKAVAGEARVPFLYASGSEFDEMFVGVGASRIREMFQSAKEQAPAIVFIDEIDAVGSARNPRDPQHARMTLNQLLTEMDGFSETQGIVVIGATNVPEVLDKALLRPGRFDKHVYVNLPDIRGRHAILSLYLKRIPLAKDVDVEVLAKVTPGFSGADLYKLVNMAKIKASIENKREIAMQHLDRVRDEMILGVERKTAMTLEDRKLTAYHESGHALVALFTPDTHPIHKATIIPRGNALGMVAQVPEKDEYSVTKTQLLARLDVAMGGRAAEHLVFGADRVTTGASNDFGQATKIAHAMVTKYGMSERVGNAHFTDEDLGQLSGELRAKIESEVSNLLDASYARAISILQMHRNELDSLANTLLEHETLTREEIVQVCQGTFKPRPIHTPPVFSNGGPSSSTPPKQSSPKQKRKEIIL